MTADRATERVLVIKLGALGDVVQALGPMRAIRDHHTDAHITVLTRRPFSAFIRATGMCDEVMIDPQPKWWQFRAWAGLKATLNDGRYSRVYDLQTSDRSSGYFKLFSPKPEWSGIAARCSHPHTNPNRDHMHTIERQAEQLSAAGIADVPVPSLDGIEADLSSFNLPARFTLFVPGGAAHRPDKRWPIRHYKTLAGRLDQSPAPAVVVGTRDERALGHEITTGLANARDLTGQTDLLQLASIAKRADAAIGNDSGPMHLCAVAGTPSVVLYSHASDPALCAQRGPMVTILREQSLDAISVDGAAQALGNVTGS